MNTAVKQQSGAGACQPKTTLRQSIRVRRIMSTDRAAVLSMHARCSRESRYSRWLSPSAVFPASYLRSVTAGAADHIAVVATVDSRPGRLIGLASAALTSDGSRELGLLVEDQYQAQGIGTMMLDALRASLDPDEPLCAYALAENRWLLGKLARFGALTIDHDFGVFYARVEL